ncbi:glutathione S-transferase family protein [Undibacterium sp.]|uniref:glutathione S-transferase family protein n=1 Tax=Undibacterium sp. TaxID=1914977 RepID=UPI00374D89F7
MIPDRRIVLFHSPQSRSACARVLLEELGADYQLHALNMKAAEQRGTAYLAVNPMGKVPAILHGDVLVTEQAAVCMYLAELYAKAGLSPAPGDPLRGAYLRWMVFYGSCFEPAVVDLSLKREPAPPSLCPYGSFETVLETVRQQLSTGPYLLGERYTAADVLWGSALTWIVAYKLVPELPEIVAYVDLINKRPAVMRAAALDAELVVAQN